MAGLGWDIRRGPCGEGATRAALVGAALFAVCWGGGVSEARAESSAWNLHLDPSLTLPTVGLLEPGEGALQGLGLEFWGGLDWQLAAPVALELLGGAGHTEHLGAGCLQADVAPDGTCTRPLTDAPLVHGALGLRVRFADDDAGYANAPRGNLAGNGWLSAHVGAMAWRGPELALDLGAGYEFSLFSPIQVGLFARGILGIPFEGDGLDLIVSAGLSLSFEVRVGAIPEGRHGVAEVRIEGLERLDPQALAVCLATRERPRFGFEFGRSASPVCDVPPFDDHRLRLGLFAWPWSEWPLFDPGVFDRDVARVERWLRARGHYEGRVLEASVDPPAALGGAPRASPGCGPGEAHGCEARVTLRVSEGAPVHVVSVELHGLEALDGERRRRLRSVLLLRDGDVMDEALFDRSREALQRLLADDGYPDARAEGHVKVNAARREAFVEFQLDAGQPGVLGRICVGGHGALPPGPILAATFLSPGQRFSLQALDRAQRAVFALGTVSSVEIHPFVDGAAPASAPPGVDDIAAPPAEPSPAAAAPSVRAPGSCTPPPVDVPDGTRIVDIDVDVAPGRLERIGLGVGLQAGDLLTFGSQSADSSSQLSAQALQQWDVHLLLVGEWRNLLDNMLRLRLEERPRLIFPAPFPGVESPSGIGPTLGNKILTTVRWPGVIEPRTALFASVQHDYGPLPLYGFFRHELDWRIGLERTFFDGRFYLATALRGNLFVPDAVQGLRQNAQREVTRALMVELSTTLDLRDDPRSPSRGAFFSLGIQQAGFGGVSTWDYTRITGEARGYVPLGLGVVLAGRAGIGAMIVEESYGLDPSNLYDLDALGPLSQQLQGGGAISNRGFPPGLEGDVVRRRVDARPLPDGSQAQYPSVLISGGIRRWEASLELRVPLTESLGLVLFADAGNVSRTDDFHFDVVNLAFGPGLRYRTPIGPLRLDWAIRPRETEYVGPSAADPRPPVCSATVTDECRPGADVFSSVPGAIHITIGEAF